MPITRAGMLFMGIVRKSRNVSLAVPLADRANNPNASPVKVQTAKLWRKNVAIS